MSEKTRLIIQTVERALADPALKKLHTVKDDQGGHLRVRHSSLLTGAECVEVITHFHNSGLWGKVNVQVTDHQRKWNVIVRVTEVKLYPIR